MLGEIEPDFYEVEGHRPEYHCRHGNYIGSPSGPDFLCWACEEGLTQVEYEEYCWWSAWNRSAEEVRMWLHMLDVVTTAAQNPTSPFTRQQWLAYVGKTFLHPDGWNSIKVTAAWDTLGRLTLTRPATITLWDIPQWYRDLP